MKPWSSNNFKNSAFGVVMALIFLISGHYHTSIAVSTIQGVWAVYTIYWLMRWLGEVL